MRSTVEILFEASYCNQWPMIEIIINNQLVWSDRIINQQVIKLEFDVADHNTVSIGYLDKKQGPDQWDTELDEQGNIVADQHAIIKMIKIAGSRCDFLINDMVYQNTKGNTLSNLFGFMSEPGYYKIEFPCEIYNWVLKNRQAKIFDTKQRSSSLDYWTNYIGNNDDPETEKLLKKIKSLLEQL
jgi:hypothetical protein